jgi:DNA-binding NarL/FixJ family response regulator
VTRAAPRLRVVIADDTPAMAAFLEELIRAQADMEFVAVGRDTASAIDLVGGHQPDVVVIDVRMPGGGGEVAAATIRAANPSVRIVALSTRSEEEVIAGMLAAGADAYVIKGPDVGEILGAIRQRP